MCTDLLKRIAGNDYELSFFLWENLVQMTINHRKENDTMHMLLYVCMGRGKIVPTSAYHDNPSQT